MKLIVNPHKIELVQEEAVNEKEINISKCQFEFNEEITDDFVKEAYFTLNGETYKKIIVNNECTFPQEVLVKEGTIELGVVATYTDIISQEVTRYNPTPVYFKTDLGSLKEAQNSEEITPSEMEQYEQALQDGLNSLDDALDDLQDKVDSGYFDGKDGVDGVTPTIGNNGNWYLGNTDTGKPSRGEQGLPGQTGQTGTPGQDGISPMAIVSKSGDTTTISITDKNGTTTATVKDGQDGTNGKDGRDGAIQYTAGNNITIENNVISATGTDLSNYYNKNEVNNITGSLNDLDTENKTNLVNAINELANLSSGLPELTGSTIYLPSLGAGAYKIVNTATITNSQGASLMVEGGSILIVVKYGNTSMGYVFARNGTIYYVYLSGYYTKDFGSLLEPYNTMEYTPTGNYNPATKKYVDDSIAAIPTPDMSNYYTKNEVDSKIIVFDVEINYSWGMSTLTAEQKEHLIEVINKAKDLPNYCLNLKYGSNDYVLLTRTPQLDTTQTGNITYSFSGLAFPNSNDNYGRYVNFRVIGKWSDGLWDMSTTTATLAVEQRTPLYQDISSTINATHYYTALPKSAIIPTDNRDFTNKKYVDDAIASVAGGSDVSIYNFDIVGQSINDNQSLNATNKTALQELLNTLYTNGVNMFSLLVSGTNGMVMSDKDVKYQLLISPNRNTIELQNKPTILYFGGYIQPAWISGNVIAYLKMTISLTWSNDVCTVTSAEYSWTQTGFADANEVLTKTNSTYYVPSSSFNPATKKYVDDKYKAYTGYDATKTQVLKNINGTLTWVDE